MGGPGEVVYEFACHICGRIERRTFSGIEVTNIEVVEEGSPSDEITFADGSVVGCSHDFGPGILIDRR